MPMLADSTELKATQPEPLTDALNVSSQCSANIISARPLLWETVAFGTLLACGYDEEVRVYRLVDARRVQDDQEMDWRWAHWKRLRGGHSAPVSDLQTAPDTELRIVSCGMDGRIVVWNFPAGRAETVLEMGCPVLRFIPLLLSSGDAAGPGTAKQPVYFCLVPAWRDNAPTGGSSPAALNYRLCAIAATVGAGGKRSRKKTDSAGVRRCESILQRVQATCLSVGQGGRFIVSANLGHLLVYRVSRKQRFSHYTCDGSQCRIVSVAAHPRERSAAVGLSDGRVLLVHNLFTAGRPVHTQLQWHFRPVSGLAYAPDGCALYSGGEEAVLVKWDTSPEAGDRSRAFLPRLGAGIVGLVSGPAGGAAVAVSLADNALLVVDSTLGQAGRVRGLLVGDAADEAGASGGGNRLLGLLRDPQTECIAMSGQPGVVQFYSVSGQRRLGALDVARANYTAMESAVVSKVTPARVELAAFSDRGAWLATYDLREDSRYGAEMWLRLWLRRPLQDPGGAQTAESQLRFSQCAEEGLTQRMAAMAFQPCSGERKLVCAYTDGGFACWTREDRVQHLAKPGREAEFTAHWTVTRTWRLGYNLTGGPLAFDPTGQYLLTCHQSHSCAAAWRTCDLSTPPPIYRLTDPSTSASVANDAGGGGGVTFCSMWDNGRSVVVCGRDRMRVWDRKSSCVLADAAVSVTSGVEDQKFGMLILLCSAERTLVMLHSGEPGELSRIRLNCPSESLHLCVTEDTFVFLTRNRRLYIYPESATPPVDGAEGDVDAAQQSEVTGANQQASAQSMLGRVFNRHSQQRRDAGQALEERLCLFAESDAFAAPGLARFVSGNLRLMRLRLLEEEGATAPTASSGDARGLEAKRRRRGRRCGGGVANGDEKSVSGKGDQDAHAADSNTNASMTTADGGVGEEAGAADIAEAAFERALCRCLQRLSSAESLPSMRQLRRQRRQERRRHRQEATAIAAAAFESAKAAMQGNSEAAAAPSLSAAPIAPPQDGDSEPDVIIVSTTPAPPLSLSAADGLKPLRRAKRLANGSLTVDLDDESSSGHSSGRKRRHRKRSRSLTSAD